MRSMVEGARGKGAVAQKRKLTRMLDYGAAVVGSSQKLLCCWFTTLSW